MCLIYFRITDIEMFILITAKRSLLFSKIKGVLPHQSPAKKEKFEFKEYIKATNYYIWLSGLLMLKSNQTPGIIRE